MVAQGKILSQCYITSLGSHDGWKPADVARWVANAGGTYQQKLSDNTTHLLMDEKTWKDQGSTVRRAVELNSHEQGRIKIISYDWLRDSLVHKSKKREKPYMWEKMCPGPMKAARQKSSNGAKNNFDEAGGSEGEGSQGSDANIHGPRNHVGMMAEVFHQSTDDFLDEHEKKRIDRSIELERRAEEDMKAEELEQRRRAKDNIDKGAYAFKNGAKKARNQTFSANHHIYADDTGFKYDVLLTKVDTRKNRNERWALTLQIYQSNSEPFTYAMNAQFSGTASPTTNNVLAATGCNFPTALRAFKTTFKEKTGVDWDQRLKFAAERSKREADERKQRHGSENGRAVPHAPMSNEDFASLPFQYYPPVYGAKGRLPDMPNENHEQAAAGSESSHTIGDSPTPYSANEANIGGANGAGSHANYSNAHSVDTTRTDQYLDFIDEGLATAEDDDTGMFADTLPPGSDNAFDFPFGGDSTYINDPTTHQTENQGEETFFDANPNGFPAYIPDTQDIGETQMASQARREFEELVSYASMSDAATTALDEGQRTFASDLGPSILGKRKASPNGDAYESARDEKQPKLAGSSD